MPEQDLPRIPWAVSTQVTEFDDSWLKMTSGSITVTVSENGEIDIEHDSRREIGNYMTKSLPITEELRGFLLLRDSEGTEDEWIRAWLRGKPAPGTPPGRSDVLEWDPEWAEWKAPQSSHQMKLGPFGGNVSTKGFDNWGGSWFEFWHFIDALDPDRAFAEPEGAVIKWNDDDTIEVWTGDFEGFINSQDKSYMDLSDREEWAALNQSLENGLIWAFDKLGAFKDPSRIPVPVEGVLQRDPDLLYPEIVAEIFPYLNAYPAGIREAVNAWLVRRRIESETVAGQTYIWPQIYPEET